MVKFAYKDSATRAVKHAQQNKQSEYSLKYADQPTVKKYTQMDLDSDFVYKMRAALGIGAGLRYKGGPNGQGYGSNYPTLSELETQFKVKLQQKRQKTN